MERRKKGYKFPAVSTELNRKGTGLRKYDGHSVKARARLDKGIRSFYEEIDLPELKRAIELHKDPKFQMLYFALLNPQLRTCSFPEICRRCKITIGDLTEAWRNFQVSKGMFAMMKHIPQAMEDTVKDALSREVTCPSCGGTGKTAATIYNKMKGAICRECYGDGKLRISGDKDARQQSFEAAGLLKKSAAGPAVQVNVGGNLPSLEDSIKDIEAVTDITPETEAPTNVEPTNRTTGETADPPEAAADPATPGQP